MRVYRFSGKHCCNCVPGIGYSEKCGQRKWVTFGGGMQGQIRHRPIPLRWPRQAWNGSGKVQETGTEEPLGAGSPSSPRGRGVRTCRNGKPSPGLHVEVKDYRLPRCSNKTTPLTMTTVNHKIMNVSGLEGPGRASSPSYSRSDRVYSARGDEC